MSQKFKIFLLPLLFYGLAILIILSLGCSTTLSNLPSKCDNLENSLLCDISEKYEVRLEDIGNILIVANDIAIGEDLYSKDDAIRVMNELRAVLDNPVSYAFFRANIYEKINAYPGLLDIASVYFNELENVTQIMYSEDQDLLKGWLDRQISILEGR